jgi:hypothetical protein
VPEANQRLGLAAGRTREESPEEQRGALAAQFVAHLEKHPLDMDAREKLAVLYADEFGRIDLAADQLEQMIGMPQQPQKSVFRWLNLLADLQVRCGAPFETVAATLQRVIDAGANFSAADLARQRLALLKLEFKAKEKSQAVKLGSYEQNIGLKRGSLRNQP